MRRGDGSGDGDGVARLLICDPTTTFPCWWRRWRGAGGGGGESGAFLGYRSVWVSLGHLATTTTGQPRRQLHDESESLLIISLSAKLIALAFSDVGAECV